MRLAAIALLVGCSAASPTATRPEPDRIDRQASLSVETRYFDHEVTYYVSGPGVELAKLPVQEWLGLPWSGRASLGGMIRVPLVGGAQDWSKAEGDFKVACEQCTMGDDKAKLPMPGAGAFVGDGLDFGHITFANIELEAKLTGGSLEVTKWVLDSPDVKVVITGRMALMPVLAESHVEACIRFQGTPALAARDPRLSELLEVTGAVVAADGMYNVRVSGRFADPRRLGQVCDGSVPLTDEPTTVDAPVEQPEPEDTDLQKAIDAGIQKLTETTYHVSLKLLTKALENPMALAKGARVVPAMKDGKAMGFKLYAIRPSGIYAKLGFKNGDTLTAINGVTLTDAEQALELYTQLSALKVGAVITVDITRRGKTSWLTYTLTK